jgi:hypothetical protein
MFMEDIKELLGCQFCAKFFRYLFTHQPIWQNDLEKAVPGWEATLKEHLHELHLKTIKYDIYREVFRQDDEITGYE